MKNNSGINGTMVRLVLTCLCAIFFLTAPAWGTNHALLIGVGAYPHLPSKDRLEGPSHDVRALSETLITSCDFAPKDITRLVDSQATHTAILKALGGMKNKTRPGDFIFIYFSGHGTSWNDNNTAVLNMDINTGALVPVDFSINTTLEDMREKLIIGKRDLFPIIQDLEQSRNVLAIFDACYSGQTVRSYFPSRVVRGKPRRLPLPANKEKEVVDDDDDDPPSSYGADTIKKPSYPYANTVYISAAGDYEEAMDIDTQTIQAGFTTVDGHPHGALTNALLHALKGTAGADIDGNGSLTYMELKNSVSATVSRDFNHTPCMLYLENWQDIPRRVAFRVPPSPPPEDISTTIHTTLGVRLEGAARKLKPEIEALPNIKTVTGDYDVLVTPARATTAGAQDLFHFYLPNQTLLASVPTREITQRLSRQVRVRELKTSSQQFESFQAHQGSLKVTDWDSEFSPEINGIQTNFLKQHEMCRSVDIGGNDTILVGANWSVYALDRKGKKKWRADVPRTVWAVNIARDNKTAVATHSGGEIRWYRMSDGAVLLSLFVHPDGKRWIISTPDGYYDASPGADTLMGWHINNGHDQAASFYPLSKFKSTFYRPDVIANVIKYNDTKKARQVADNNRRKAPTAQTIQQMLTPAVAILFPENNAAISTDTVRVRYRVRTPSGEKVTGIKVLLDGRPLEGQRGIQRIKPEEIAEITVPVPPRDLTLSIIAENRFSASDPAKVRLKWKGTEKFILKPKLYVLAMGSSAYKDKNLRLGYPAKDARDVAAVFKKQKGGIYRDVEVNLLTDPSWEDVMDGLEWIEKQTTALDVAVVFLAGHGVNDRNGNYYYLPVNADPDRLKRTCISYAAIKDTITGLPGKVLFFLDTCHSGNVMGGRRGIAGDLNQIANDLASAENGVVVFTSSSGTQYSLEDHAWGNGAFTKALVEGLSGKADYHKDRKISISELTLYVAERVKELTHGRQTPTTSKPDTIADFPVVVRQ